jgi:hypothetical protein
MRNAGFLIFLVLTLCACAALSEKQRDESFDTAISHYTKAIRWGDFAAANEFRRPEDPAIITPPPASEQIRVTACEPVQISPSASGNESAVTVRITYYRDDGMTLKTLIDQQSWEYAAAEKTWYITSPPPVFK